jgi:PGF-CTERM protein
MSSLMRKALPLSTNVTYKDYVAMYITKQVPISSKITWTLIAVAYHSDGKTHGPTTGELGKTTHMQLTHLIYPKPIRTYEEWKNATKIAATTAAKTAAAEKPQEKQPGFEGLIALAGLLAAAYLALQGRQ